MGERISTVLFVFPDSREIRHMREPPGVGSRVRSRRRRVCYVAQVIDSGSDTYVATCVGESRVVTAAHRPAHRTNEAVRQDERDLIERDPAADLLRRVKELVSPRAIRRRWRDRNYLP